jgi:vacuolar-type H+-ATPase subunit E/Vma4
LDRLKKEAEDKPRHLTLDRPRRALDEEAWLTAQRNETGSPYFKKQSEERKKLAEEQRKKGPEDERKRADEERKRAGLPTLKVFLTKHRDLVDKFLDIAERKVSVLDDYGDENWNVLPEEIHKCLTKIAAREKWIDISKASPSSPLKKALGGYMTPTARSLASSLDSEFRIYHEARKRLPNSAQDFRTLRNIEFEIYVRRKLEAAGYTVVGTRVTGDQGADFIAKRNGRTIAIQAKGYTGTVGNSAVQEIVGALRLYNADEGWVVTNSAFSRSARELAHANKIRLIDGNDLMDSLP